MLKKFSCFIEKHSARLLSFDVFDTVVLRRVYYPHHIFFLAGIKAQSELKLSPGQFMRLRWLAEFFLRKYIRLFTSREEITLKQIYDLLGFVFRWPAALRYAIMRFEMETEKQWALLNPEMLPLIRNWQHHCKLIFTSDMYLPCTFLRDLLNQLDDSLCKIPLYVSSQTMMRKRHGSLYKYILRNESIEAGQMVHIGDHPHNDVAAAQELGISALTYTMPIPEVPWLKPVARTRVYEGMFRKASQLTYLSMSQQGIDSDLCVLGAFVAGPVLFGYCHWLLEQAKALRLERLYFLARDCQIIYRIAACIAKNMAYPVELKYLHASRHAWILPSIEEYERINEEEVLFRFSKRLTLRHMIHRCKLEHLDEKWLAEKAAAFQLTMDEPVSFLTLGRLKSFFTDRDIVREAEKRAFPDLELVSEYFRQEGLFDSVFYGVVDVGWRGSLANAIRRILKKNEKHPYSIPFFFVDLYDTPEFSVHDEFFSYVKSTRNPYKHAIRGELEILMEILTTADHHGLYGYQRKGSKVYPRFITENLQPVLDWGVEALQQVILKYAANLFQLKTHAELPMHRFHEDALNNFYRFLSRPDEKIVRKINAFPYTVQQIKLPGESDNTISAPYVFGDLSGMIKQKNPVRTNDLWIQGSLSLTKNIFVKWFFCLFYKILSVRPVRALEKMIKGMK